MTLAFFKKITYNKDWYFFTMKVKPDKRLRRSAENGKGGESMALEAIQEVQQAEANAKAGREAAAAQAKQKLLDARKEARQIVDQARQRAEAQVREKMAQAEAEAEQETQKVLAEAERDCEALRQNARGRLEQASQVIVEKVVNR